MLAICKYIRILNKIFFASPSKDIILASKGLWCHIASCSPSKLLPLNPANFYLTSALDKTHHNPVNVPFSAQSLEFFSAALEVSELPTSLTVIDDILW